MVKQLGDAINYVISYYDDLIAVQGKPDPNLKKALDLMIDTATIAQRRLSNAQ